MVPEKNNELSLRACSALARALHAKDACGLVRFVPRAPFIVSMMAMMPCLSELPTSLLGLAVSQQTIVLGQLQPFTFHSY